MKRCYHAKKGDIFEFLYNQLKISSEKFSAKYRPKRGEWGIGAQESGQPPMGLMKGAVGWANNLFENDKYFIRTYTFLFLRVQMHNLNLFNTSNIEAQWLSDEDKEVSIKWPKTYMD